MSRVTKLPSSQYVPLIAIAYRLNRALQDDMVDEAHRRGYPELKQSHNSVFATLDRNGSRASDMAAQAGMTRQSMGEIIRDMERIGYVEMGPDPSDKRAKLVTWTPKGIANAREGYGHIRDLEQLFADELGEDVYDQVRDALVRITELVERAQDE